MDAVPELEGPAKIYAFPAPEPAQRLRMALRALTAALDEQRAAVAAFRDSMMALQGATAGLGASLSSFQADMGRLERQVKDLGETSRDTAALL